MRPNEFLWDGIVWDCAEGCQIRSLLKVNIEAVAKANFLLAHKRRWLDSEWILNLTAALFEAGERGLSQLLAEDHALECSLNFHLLSLDVLGAVRLAGLCRRQCELCFTSECHIYEY